MTLYAVISDIHANFDALLAVEADAINVAQKLKEDLFFICLGDVIDYGPQPNECMNWILQKENEGRIILIRGNHDDDVSVEDITQFPLTINTLWWPITMWSRQALKTEHKIHIRQWEDEKNLEGKLTDFTLVHGSFIHKNNGAIRDEEQASDNFDALKKLNKDYGLFGHTHYQGYFVRIENKRSAFKKKYTAIPYFTIQETNETRQFFNKPGTAELSETLNVRKWLGAPIVEREIKDKADLHLFPTLNILFNPGSVGQPRRPEPWSGKEKDVIPVDVRAAYMLLHINGDSSPRFAFRRKKYETDNLIKKIKAIKWQDNDAEKYLDFLRVRFEEKRLQLLHDLQKDNNTQINADLRFVEEAISIMNGQTIYYKPLPAENEHVSRLNGVTQLLIERKLLKNFGE